MVDHCLNLYNNKIERFDPYSMANILRYLSKGDEYLDTNTLTLFGHFGKQLVETISERQMSLIDADLDDPLIDLGLHDVLSIVKVFAVLAKPHQLGPKSDHHKHVPKLFEQVEPQVQEEYHHTEETYIQLYQPEM